MDAGSKLQKIATTIFIIEIVGVIITAIAIAATAENIVAFFIIIAVGIFNAYLIYLVMTAIGEAAENSAEAVYILNEIRYPIKKLADAQGNGNASVQSSTSRVTKPVASFTGTWTCTSCGKQNPKSVNECDCGYRRTY